MGTGAVGDVLVRLVVVPVGIVVVELEVVEATELVSVESVDGTDVESSIEVLDPMLAVAEDRLAVVDEAAAERLDAAALAVFDVKVFTADKVPDATMMGAVADPVAAADDSALLGGLGPDWVAIAVLLAELGAALGAGAALV